MGETKLPSGPSGVGALTPPAGQDSGTHPFAVPNRFSNSAVPDPHRRFFPMAFRKASPLGAVMPSWSHFLSRAASSTASR